MKRLYLFCNAHIDPVWLWTLNEGKGATLSTFNSAANLLDNYDFIFCHNESYLYELIKEIHPELFKKIKEQIKAGKWKIMGGWYIQPDCLMPSGETFLRVIKEGKLFFKNEFGADTTVACNLDAFGHSKGLVQIIAKTGHKAALVCRPHFDFWPAESNWIVWKGFADTEVNVYRDPFHYSSELGKIREKLSNEIKHYEGLNKEEGFCLWGVGDHGGGPSRQDLEAIEEMKKEAGVDLVHSFPEEGLCGLKPDIEYDKSLITVFPGCYTSVRAYKSKFAEAQRKYMLAETMLSVAAMFYGADYPEDKLKGIMDCIMLGSFHDILSGTCSEKGMEESLALIQSAISRADDIISNTHLKLSLRLKPGAEGAIPVCVFNPLPYKSKRVVEADFILPSIRWEKEDCVITVKDSRGNVVASQSIKENSNFNVHWHKRVAFESELEPFSISRFDIEYTFGKKEEKPVKAPLDTISFHVYEDNEDSWSQGRECYVSMGKNPVSAEMTGMRVVENGELFTVYEKQFEYGLSKIILNEKHYNNYDCVDLSLRVYWNDKNKMLKMHIAAPQGEYIGQVPFGTDTLYSDGRECCAQYFTGVRTEGDVFAAINNGVFGSSYKDGVVMVSLLRSGAYAAHPATEENGTVRPLVDNNRFIAPFDQGVNTYEFRICRAEERELDRIANEFNNPPYAVYIMPIGDKERLVPDFEVDNPLVTMVCFKKSKEKDGFIIRLHNNTPEKEKAGVRVKGSQITVRFKPYEVKNVLWCDGVFSEIEELII